MSPIVLSLCLLGSAPDGGVPVLAELLAPIVPAGWKLSVHAGAVVLTRESPVPLFVRGLADKRSTAIHIEVTPVARLTPAQRAGLVTSNGEVLEKRSKLTDQMTRFEGGTADSEPEYRPRTPAERRLVERYEALNRRIVEVPTFYFGDFVPVRLEVSTPSGRLRPDESIDCADCSALRNAIEGRLSTYR